MDFTPYLDDLEARISPEIEQRLAFDWESFARGYFTGEVFRPSREKNPARIEWKPVCVNDAFRDPELMIYSQLKSVSDTLASGSGLLFVGARELRHRNNPVDVRRRDSVAAGQREYAAGRDAAAGRPAPYRPADETDIDFSAGL